MSSPSPDIVSARFYNTLARAVLEESLHHLTEGQRQDVLQLVDSYPMLCSDVPGRTNGAVHDVDVGDAIPIKQHPYAPHKKNIVQEEVDHVLKIEPADSAWSSPLVLATQEGKVDRFCVDYRKPNNVTKADAFPIPHLKDCIE